MMLPVSAPFHSALMAPAAEAMREALAKVAKNAPVVPVVANVARPAPRSPIPARSPLLVEQVTGPVRWRETVNGSAERRDDALRDRFRQGADRPRRRIDKSLDRQSRSTPGRHRGALGALNRLFKGRTCSI
jgi:[acyl-carrier-protein] S-malonyltransferase